MPKITPTYDQKYLDEKFKNMDSNFIEIKTLLKAQGEQNAVGIQRLSDKIGRLENSETVLNRDMKDVKNWMKDFESKLASSNFFSVKGVLFIVAIFSILMTAFLLNGVELLNNAT